MDFADFNHEYVRAKERVQRFGSEQAAAEQARLRPLVAQLTTEDDRRVAYDLIEHLVRRSDPPPPPSSLYEEALRIREAIPTDGTTEQRIAALADARRRIWRLADRAPDHEGGRIRYLTRSIESLEEWLRDPPWDDPPTDHPDN